MKKIVHLSDLHIGYQNSDGADLGERFHCIVRNLAFEKQPASDYVVVISGDLVDSAPKSSDYAEARLYVEQLREHGFTVLVCPGNHDYGTGVLGKKKFVKKFKRAFYGDPDFEYPRLDLIDGVAFIGLDSMAQELNWYDRLWAEGELGKRQRRRLDQILGRSSVQNADRRVVYLHHHPFDPRPFHHLKDSEKLREVIEGRSVDAILYGHNHAGKIHNGHWGIPRAYDAGTTTRKKSKPGYHRVLDLARDPRMDYDGDFHCEE